jgi:hypothetical protein
MVSPDADHHVVIGAFRDGRLLGAASHVVVRQTDFAEVVSHAEQAHGVGTAETAR